MEQQFQDELDEAPYIAKLRTVCAFSPGWPHGPSQILDYLYLGAAEDATNVKHLRDLGVTHVINCAAGYCMTSQEFYGDIKYLGFEAEDDDSYNMLQHFEDAYRLIEEARTSGGKVLVHCLMGINRSGVITCAYCMIHKHMGPISSARFVKKNRPMLLTNEGFQRQLVTFARERGMLHQDKDQL